MLRLVCDHAQDSNAETIQTTMSGAMIDPTQLSGEQLQYMKQQIEDVRILTAANFTLAFSAKDSARLHDFPPSLRRFILRARL